MHQQIPPLPKSDLIKGILGFHVLWGLILGWYALVGVVTYHYPYQCTLYFILPYLTYSLTLGRHELKDGARWLYFSKRFYLFQLMRNYLQLSFIQTADDQKAIAEAEAKPNAQFLIAAFPHGTASDFRILMDGMLHQIFPHTNPKIRTLAASVLFRIPIIGQFASWTGCIDARRKVAERAFDNGRSIVVLPGGEAEQIRTTYGKEQVYLKSRMGFLKLAMRKDVPVIPTYVFGSSDLYYTSQALFGWRLWLQKSMGIAITFAMGVSLMCPLPVKTTMVMGRPLTFSVKEKGMPTDDELIEAHSLFCKELKRIFDENKKELGYGDRELDIQ